jgi:DNA-binding NtrC family response regulator
MSHPSHQLPVSGSTRRRLARCLVGSHIKDIERDLVLETLATTDGNRTVSARLLGVSIRTLRNKITEYAADGVEVPDSLRGVCGPVKPGKTRRLERVVMG